MSWRLAKKASTPSCTLHVFCCFHWFVSSDLGTAIKTVTPTQVGNNPFFFKSILNLSSHRKQEPYLIPTEYSRLWAVTNSSLTPFPHLHTKETCARWEHSINEAPVPALLQCVPAAGWSSEHPLSAVRAVFPPRDQAVMYSGRGQDKKTGRIPSATPHTDQLHIHEGHQKAMSNNIYNTEVLT